LSEEGKQLVEKLDDELDQDDLTQSHWKRCVAAVQ
jgi:hypothetical protein